MGNIVYIAISLFVIVVLKYILKIDFKKAKAIEENKELEKITDKFPENADIAKEMLEMLGHKTVKIEEVKDTKTSLYIAVTNKILIADLKNNYGRIQTIAHECIHSCQDRNLLMFNFIFSNFSILYFFTITILTVFNITNNVSLQFFILLLIFFIQCTVRGILEIEAMTKAKILAKEYMEKKKICSDEEIGNLLSEYEKINKMGIPFTIYTFLVGALIKIIIYSVITLI